MTPPSARLAWSLGLAAALVAGGSSVGIALLVAAQQRAASPAVELPATPPVAQINRP